jgi:hypothetical protein
LEALSGVTQRIITNFGLEFDKYCDMRAVGQQPTVKTLFTTVAMATDKHATIHNHATVDAFSLGSVPVVTPSNSTGIEEVFSLGSVPRLYD